MFSAFPLINLCALCALRFIFPWFFTCDHVAGFRDRGDVRQSVVGDRAQVSFDGLTRLEQQGRAVLDRIRQAIRRVAGPGFERRRMQAAPPG